MRVGSCNSRAESWNSLNAARKKIYLKAFRQSEKPFNPKEGIRLRERRKDPALFKKSWNLKEESWNSKVESCNSRVESCNSDRKCCNSLKPARKKIYLKAFRQSKKPFNPKEGIRLRECRKDPALFKDSWNLIEESCNSHLKFWNSLNRARKDT
ncbi:hypothetical protein B0H99_104144 [Planomicrobium soli]|uniref:Uncharacterized protein n=1 Tax=Planomicrobium soli TaxID=1176648 RepID=A0A2P8H397_9BACL|nr:hypothetical protein [Planomicrobium soli]PSL40682.1 hypothetical protein B0H99_104144 [Planomicrobium soli]